MAKCAICKQAFGRRQIDHKPNCTRPKCYAAATRSALAKVAERAYENAYRAHQKVTAGYRSMEIGDTEWQVSRNALTIARDAHEAFLFGGTDNESHY